MIRWLAILTSVCLVDALCRLPTAAAEPPSKANEFPHFHRLFLPPEEIDSRNWKQRYLPVESNEFERGLQVVAGGTRGVPSAGGARLDQADYQAQLVGDDLLIGTAELNLTSLAKEPVLLSLVPMNLAVESPAWSEPVRPAQLGVDSKGELFVLTEGSRLICQWSRKGERTASGAVKFQLELPPSPRTRIHLKVPRGAEVAANRGIVSQTAGDDSGTNRWIVELGGNGRVELRIVPAESAGERRVLTLLRQATTYELTSRGINVGAQLRLDVHGEPLSRLQVDLDPSMHLIGAKFGDQSLPWSATTDLETGQAHVQLEFPEPLTGTGRVLQLSGVAPLITNRRFVLPRLQPRGVAWQEGTASLLVPESLVLEQLLTSGCRQSRVTPLPAPLAGESIEIQNFEQGATAEVLVAEPRKRIALRRASVVQINSAEITNRCAVAIAALPEQTHRLLIPVMDGWTIDAVESSVPNRTVEWNLREAPGKPMELQIDVAPGGQAVVQGHRVRTPEDSFEASQLSMLDFANFGGGNNLISVRAAEGLDLRWTGTESVRRFDAVNLASEQLGLFPRFPEGPVFAEDEHFAQSVITVARRNPSFAADIHIDAVVQQGTLTETFTILCTPEIARVERLLVHFSQSRQTPIEWRLAGGNNSGQFSARKLSAGEQAKAGLRAAGEVWELLLQLARPGVFELRGQRSTPFTTETPLTLASVYDAASQRGTLAIRALGNVGLAIKNRSLMSVPAELLDDERYQTARATYHYQPAGDDLGSEPLVSIAPAKPTQAETGAWVWDLRLISRYASNELATHAATLYLETAGRRSLELELPPDASLIEAWLDAERLSLPKAKRWQIELPPGQRRATLLVRYSSSANLPTITNRHQPPFPRVDLPVVKREWNVWLPPEYRLCDADDCAPTEPLPLLTWSERLFGALGRSSNQHVFNPLVAADWREAFSVGQQSEYARSAQYQTLVTLGTLAGDYADDEELTCGQLLSAASDSEAQRGRIFLIDSEGMTEARITPQTRLVFPPAESPLARGTELLRRSRLLLVTIPGATMLTTAARAASFRDQLLRVDNDSVAAMAHGPLAATLRLATERDSLGTFQTVELWRADVGVPSSVWVAPPDSALTQVNPHGWRSYTLRCAPDGSQSIRILHFGRMQSLSWAVLLAVIGLGLWRPMIEFRGLIVLLGVSAAMSMVVPQAYTALFSSAFVGGLFCVAARLARFEPRGPITEQPSPLLKRSKSSIVQPLAGVLLFAAAMHLTAALDAAEPAASEPKLVADSAANSPLYTVLVPIDDQQQRIGTKYYVPDSLYEELLRRVAQITGKPAGWLVNSGDYIGTLARDPVTSGLGLTSFQVRFDLQVFQSNTPVLIRLPRDPWGAIIRAVRLDGRNTQPDWVTTGDSMVLGFLAVGTHRLELEVEPSTPSDSRRQGFDLTIPRLPLSTLELSYPPDVTPIEVPSALGRVDLSASGGKLRAQLGASDRLEVRWPASNGANTASPNLEVDELIWVRVRPGTTVLDARLKYRVLSGRIRTLRLLTDSRLRLLTTPATPSPLAAVHTIPGDPQQVELELAQDVTDQVTVDLSFLVNGTSGVGSLRLPRLESMDARASHRRLGISVDPALQFRVQAGEDSRVIEIGEFVSAWGGGDSKPQQAFSIPRGDPLWFLSTQPGEPHTGVEQTTSISLGRNSASVHLDAAITITGGVVAQLAIQAPMGFSVDSVSVREQDVERVARSSIDDSGRISVFLTTPLEGKQQLSLRGHWSPPKSGPFEIPQWSVLGAETKQSLLRLFRQPAVVATVEPLPGVVPREDLGGGRLENLGTPCGSFALEGELATVRVSLAPNNPQLKATAITLLTRDADKWMAELRYHVEVTDGLADSLQFEIPPQWSEPFSVEPAATVAVISTSGEQRRQLTLVPVRPLQGKHEFTLRGRVAPSPGDRLSMPDILPLHITEVQRFVVLPRTFESQQVTWDTLRLTPSRLPAEFLPRDWQPDQVAVYQVAGEHFQASLKAVQRQLAEAKVRLADIHMMWIDGGGYQAAAAFDLEPGGTAQCILELPPGCELIHLAVEQLPTSVLPAGPNRYRLALGPEQLPQHVELLYRGPAPRSPANGLQPPRFIDMKVAQTLWTVYGMPGIENAISIVARERSNAVEQELVRLETVADLVQLPAEVVGEHLPEEIARWHDSRRKRFWSGRASLRRNLVQARRATSQSEESIAARQLDQQMAAMDVRLGATRTALPPLLATDTTTRFAEMAGAGLRRQYFVTGESGGNLRLNFSNHAENDQWTRWMAAAGILLICAGVLWFLREKPIREVAASQVLAAAACIWWLLLTPSAIGLFALLLVGLFAFWTRSQALRSSAAR